MISSLKPSIYYGLLFGFLIILLSIFAYMRGVEFTFSYFSIITIVFYIFSIFFISYRLKNEYTGTILYFQAVKYVFVALMIAFLFSSAFSYVFNNYIDPEYTQEIVKESIRKTQQMLESLDVPEAKIDETMAEMKQKSQESLENPFLSTLQSIMIGSIGIFVVSLLCGIFVQRKPKEDDFLYDNEKIVDAI